MKHFKQIVSMASAAALVCGITGPFASLPSAFAAGETASVESSSAAESSAAESGSSSASSSESASEQREAENGSASKAQKAENGEKASEKKGASKSSAKGGKTGKAGKAGKSTAGKTGKASKANAKNAAKADKKKADEKKAEKDKKKKKSEGRKASGEDPAKYASKIPALVTQLDAVPDEFGEAKSVAAEYKAKVAKLDKKKAKLEKEQQRAQNVLDEMQKELSDGAGATLTMVLTGRADFDSIDSRGYLLQKVADGSSERIAQVKKGLAKVEKQKKQLKKQEKAEVKRIAEEHGKATEAALAKGNALAAKIERNVSLMRYAEPESTAAHAALRESALASVAKWYEFEDAMAGNEDVLTFGTGTEFQLGKKAFVKKWGAAIDAFYGEYYPSAPLKGHGAEMAEAAWEHKIDPRFCAAVSIVESTGGQYCIKPHNAWGWGAADDDPYNGASGWDSWESAIEAWHEGIANSTTGLATAGTVEELGETYCSSLDWAAKVVGEMQKISAEAE